MATLRIAVTGLKGAGKTVFLTSLINNLIRGTAETFEAFRKRGVSFHAEPLPHSPVRRRFPYSEYVRQFRQESPTWPRSTVDVSEFRISMEFRRRRITKVDLHLVDYPGERLLDLPLLQKSFAEWSFDMLEESEQPIREDLGRPWRQAIGQIEKRSEDSQDAVQRAVTAYREYLLACRGRGLQFLQPSAMVLPTEDSEFLNLEFCPLPQDVAEASPALAEAFAGRYEAYKAHFVKPFVAEVVRCSRQIVLVDVLRILRTGLHGFRDTQRCLEEVLKIYSYSRTFPIYTPKEWWRFVTSSLSQLGGIGQVVFVATKSDLATRNNRGRLRRLLEKLVRLAANRLSFRLNDNRIAYDYCAAYRCTEDAAKKFDGMPISVLKGRRRLDDGGVRDGVWFPGEVPEEWPSHSYDPEEDGFRFPEFMPMPLPRERVDLPVGHLNLDEIFYSMVEGLIK